MSIFDIAQGQFLYDTLLPMSSRKLAKSRKKTAAGETVDRPPDSFEKKVDACFRQLCKEQDGGASPAEVLRLMDERGWLSEYTTVIDVADTMKALGYAPPAGHEVLE